MDRGDYREALRRIGIMATLGEFDPRVAGTLPIGLEVPTSDVDVLCHAPDPNRFTAVVWAAYHDEANFSVRRWIADDRPVVASFTAHGWPFQVFGQAKPVSEQNGWRHLLVERRFLELGGPAFRAAVAGERTRGAKTESAFASVLRLDGDPYRTLLDLELSSDASLLDYLAKAGFTV